MLHNRGSGISLRTPGLAFHGSLIDVDDVRGDFPLAKERFPAVKLDFVEKEGNLGEFLGGKAGKHGVMAHALRQSEPFEAVNPVRRFLCSVKLRRVDTAENGDVSRGNAYEMGGIGGKGEEPEKRERVPRFDGGFSDGFVELSDLESAAEQNGEEKVGGSEREEVSGDVVGSSAQRAAGCTSPCAGGERGARRRRNERAGA